MPTRDEALNLVQAMIADGILGARDLSRFVPSQQAGDGESLRQEWERWYVSMGIETIIGRPLSLAPRR